MRAIAWIKTFIPLPGVGKEPRFWIEQVFGDDWDRIKALAMPPASVHERSASADASRKRLK